MNIKFNLNSSFFKTENVKSAIQKRDDYEVFVTLLEAGQNRLKISLYGSPIQIANWVNNFFSETFTRSIL
jgi:hypothetical protein